MVEIHNTNIILWKSTQSAFLRGQKSGYEKDIVTI